MSHADGVLMLSERYCLRAPAPLLPPVIYNVLSPVVMRYGARPRETQPAKSDAVFSGAPRSTEHEAARRKPFSLPQAADIYGALVVRYGVLRRRVFRPPRCPRSYQRDIEAMP